jgi:EAL domain-containing protein (putative c-di-GMP-specific phosphodiesterase class I)
LFLTGGVSLARLPAVERVPAAARQFITEPDPQGAAVVGDPLNEGRATIQALARDVISVFQPIVNLTSGRVVGVEALARFRTQSLDCPSQWFMKAWDLGLGLDLELAAARAALSALNRLPAEYFVAVNFSVAAIVTPEFQALMRPMGSRVVVELTEHARVQDYTALEAALEPLRRQGLRLSVDDVGAGFSSFEHILRLKPDIVKLDSFLTRGVHRDPARASLTKGLVAFARALNATLVAEGIENATEEAALMSLGITFGQGFYLGMPQPLAEIRGVERSLPLN